IGAPAALAVPAPDADALPAPDADAVPDPDADPGPSTVVVLPLTWVSPVLSSFLQPAADATSAAATNQCPGLIEHSLGLRRTLRRIGRTGSIRATGSGSRRSSPRRRQGRRSWAGARPPTPRSRSTRRSRRARSTRG